MDLTLLNKAKNNEKIFPQNWSDYNPLAREDIAGTSGVNNAIISLFNGNTEPLRELLMLDVDQALTREDKLLLANAVNEELTMLSIDVVRNFDVYTNTKYLQYVTNLKENWTPREYTSRIGAQLNNNTANGTYGVYLLSGLLTYTNFQFARTLFRTNQPMDDGLLLKYIKNDYISILVSKILHAVAVSTTATLKRARQLKLTDLSINILSNKLSEVLSSLNNCYSVLTNVKFDITTYTPSHYHYLVPRVSMLLMTIGDVLLTIPKITVGITDIDPDIRDDISKGDSVFVDPDDSDRDASVPGLAKPMPSNGYEVNDRTYKRSVWLKYHLNYIDYIFTFRQKILRENELYSTATNASAVVCRDWWIYYIPTRMADGSNLQLWRMKQKDMTVEKFDDLPFQATRNVGMCMLEQDGYDFIVFSGSREEYVRYENEDIYTRTNDNIYRYHVKKKKWEIVGSLSMIPREMYSLNALLRKDGKIVFFNTTAQGTNIVGNNDTYVFDPFTNDLYKEENDFTDKHPYRNNIACHNGDFYRIASKEYNPMPCWDYVGNTLRASQLQTPDEIELPIRNLIIEDGVDYTIEDPYRYATILVKPGGRLHYLAWDNKYKTIEGDTLVLCTDSNAALEMTKSVDYSNLYVFYDRTNYMMDHEPQVPPSDRSYEILSEDNLVVVMKGPTVPIPDGIADIEREEYLFDASKHEPK